MATFSNAQGFYGLVSTPTPERQNSNLTGNVGVVQQTANFGSKPIWTAGITFGATTQTITLNPLTGVLSAASEAQTAFFTTNIVLNPANNDTVTLDGIVYTFKTVAAVARDVQIGVDEQATRDNLMDEVNGAGIGAAHTSVEAETGSGASITFRALATGPAGNSIAISNSSASSWSPAFDATLSGGVDGVEYEIYDADGTDCEGIDLPASDDNPAFLMTVSAGRVKATDGADFTVKPGAISTTVPGYACLGADALSFDGDIVFTCEEMPASGVASITLNLLLEPT